MWVVQQRCFGVAPTHKSKTRDNRQIVMPWDSWIKGKSAESPEAAAS